MFIVNNKIMLLLNLVTRYLRCHYNIRPNTLARNLQKLYELVHTGNNCKLTLMGSFFQFHASLFGMIMNGRGDLAVLYSVKHYRVIKKGHDKPKRTQNNHQYVQLLQRDQLSNREKISTVPYILASVVDLFQ